MASDRALLSKPVPALLFILIALVLDQVSKVWVDQTFPLRESVSVLPFLAFFRTYNTGVAFSMFDQFSGWLIVGGRILIVFGVIWMWLRTAKNRPLYHLGFALVIAGALGNLIDRFAYGHVIDFILFHTQSWSFAIFNVADSYITIGAVLIGFEEIFGKSEQKA